MCTRLRTVRTRTELFTGHQLTVFFKVWTEAELMEDKSSGDYWLGICVCHKAYSKVKSTLVSPADTDNHTFPAPVRERTAAALHLTCSKQRSWFYLKAQVKESETRCEDLVEQDRVGSEISKKVTKEKMEIEQKRSTELKRKLKKEIQRRNNARRGRSISR